MLYSVDAAAFALDRLCECRQPSMVPVAFRLNALPIAFAKTLIRPSVRRVDAMYVFPVPSVSIRAW